VVATLKMQVQISTGSCSAVHCHSVRASAINEHYASPSSAASLVDAVTFGTHKQDVAEDDMHEHFMGRLRAASGRNLIVKNTFLHVVEFDAKEGLYASMRRRSSPACAGEDGLEELVGICESEASDLDSVAFEPYIQDVFEPTAEHVSGNSAAYMTTHSTSSERPRSNKSPLIEKNTFLDVADDVTDAGERLHPYLRRHSAPAFVDELACNQSLNPPCCVSADVSKELDSSSDAGSLDVETHIPKAMSVSILENASDSQVWTAAHSGSHEDHSETQMSKDSSREAIEGASSTELPGSQRKVKQGRGRPCKEKRQRFNLFAMKLHEVVKGNPHGFDISKIEWPGMLMDSRFAKIRDQVVADLESYRNKLLAELANQKVC
jgi:hypothetical protein